ncbi:MAG: hypothetical protein FJ270_03100 [Planctomycetes bacterium]|nr:hypothetical protein [Planctomycetota bacterium]
MIRRARGALLVAMTLALGVAMHAPPSLAALDPAAPWRVLLVTAGCPPGVAHDLAVRIERMAGQPPGPDQDGAVTMARIAEQITHLAVGRHGLQLSPAQLDAVLAVLVGGAGSPEQNTTGADERQSSDPRPSDRPSPGDTPQPFTTRNAHDLLCEWLPTPAPH